MKKLLGISIVAMLAVSPMMANAAQTAASLSASSAETGDATAIATAKYVKGAYDAAAGAINNIVTDIDVTTTQQTAATAMNGNDKMLQAGSSVAENLANVDTKIGAFTDEASGGIITNANSVSSNLKALEGRLLTAESDIDTIEGNIGNMSGLTGTATDLVGAIEEVRESAANANAANSIVVYGGWNAGGAPKEASAITTQTAADAATVVAAANAND